MRRFRFTVIVLLVVAAGCGGSGSDALSAEERAWCLDNFDIVEDAADDLGLLGFVDTWYDTEGDGIGPDGEPVPTDKNIEVSSDLSARNAEDPDALFDDLVDRYFAHTDGQAACTAAYTEEA
jgi:hypothetical protein